MHEGHHHSRQDDEYAFETLEQAAALMSYMLEHNRRHAEELNRIGHRLEAMGKSEASYLIDDAVASFNAGNMMLESALDNIMKTEE